jgi:hypothetical protein
MTTLGDLMRGKFSDEDLEWLMHYRSYMSEIEKGFEMPVAEWGVDEWKAVAKTEIFEKIREKPRLEAYRSVSIEFIEEVKQLRNTYRSGGTGKKGKTYEPKASIQEVVKAVKSRSLDSVLRYLENEENCEKVYLVGGVMFDGVDRKREVVFYYYKIPDPDIKQELKFKRLSNILSEIK